MKLARLPTLWDPRDLLRVRNCYAVLSLDEDTIEEKIFDEKGKALWHKPPTLE